LIFRLVCSNGLRRWEREGDIFNQRHIYLKTHEFRGRMLESMSNGLHTGQELLEQYRKAQNIHIEHPFEVIEAVSKKAAFSKEFTDRMKTEYEGDKTAYGIVNSITSAARSLPNEHRLETERFAGKLLEMRPSEWIRVDKIPDPVEVAVS